MPRPQTKLTIPRRVRVRMEFTAEPHPDRNAVGMTVDKKLTMLKVLMGERFGADGQRAYEDWLLLVASENSTDGGTRA